MLYSSSIPSLLPRAMAPRGNYGLHALLDQASIISLTAPTSAPSGQRRHPSPSPEIAKWRHSSLPEDEFLPSVKPSFTSSTRYSFPPDQVSSPSLTRVNDANKLADRSTKSPPQSTTSLVVAADRDWPAAWHSRDAEMWHDRVSPRRPQSPSLVGNRAKSSLPGSLENYRSSSVDNIERKKARAREPTTTVETLQSSTVGGGRGANSTLPTVHLDQREKLSLGGGTSVAGQRRSRRHSATRRSERPVGFSNRQAMAILGRVSTRAGGSSAESGSTSASPEASSGSSGVSGLLLEEGARGLDSNGWRQWTKELAEALDECIPGEKNEVVEPMSPRERLQTMVGKSEFVRSRDSGSGRINAENSLLRSISLDRGIGSLLSGSIGEQYPGESRSVKEGIQTPRLSQSASVGHGQSLITAQKDKNPSGTLPRSIPRVSSEASTKPDVRSPTTHNVQTVGVTTQKVGMEVGSQKSKDYLRKKTSSTLNHLLSQDVASLGGQAALYDRPRFAKDTEYSAWIVRREEGQMKASLKTISDWLETEGIKLVARLPMSPREMALVMSQVAEGAERLLTTESESLSFAGECALRRNMETLLEAFERQVITRNDRSIHTHSRQVMLRSLEEAQTLLEEAVSSHQIHGKRRINVCQEILPSVKQTAVSRFRGHVYGLLPKSALQQLQNELVQEIEHLGEAMGGRVRGRVGQQKPVFR